MVFAVRRATTLRVVFAAFDRLNNRYSRSELQTRAPLSTLCQESGGICRANEQVQFIERSDAVHAPLFNIRSSPTPTPVHEEMSRPYAFRGGLAHLCKFEHHDMAVRAPAGRGCR